jgi:hypothetical protein
MNPTSAAAAQMRATQEARRSEGMIGVLSGGRER